MALGKVIPCQESTDNYAFNSQISYLSHFYTFKYIYGPTNVHEGLFLTKINFVLKLLGYFIHHFQE